MEASKSTTGMSSDCTSYPVHDNWVPVPWPGWNTTAWHDDAAKPHTMGTDTYWLGSLSVGMRDASGQMYMRNRYYDPQTGQFTQPDPIGLAGGLNVYGFAAGDPVTYSDPYGLTVIFGGETDEDKDAARRLWIDLQDQAEEALVSGNWNARHSARNILSLMDRAENSKTVYLITGVDLNAMGGGIEYRDEDISGLHHILIDPDGSPGQKASPWIILAHELGGALGKLGHALPAMQAENWARNIAGCSWRIFHGSPTYSNCNQR